MAKGIQRLNGSVVLEDEDDASLINYIDLAKLCRKVYASHYQNGKGLKVKGQSIDSEDFLTLLMDPNTHQPNPLIEYLQNTTGQYSHEDDVFFVCSGAVCMSRVAAYTLQALVSGRPKDNAREHSKKFKWPKTFRSD